MLSKHILNIKGAEGDSGGEGRAGLVEVALGEGGATSLVLRGPGLGLWIGFRRWIAAGYDAGQRPQQAQEHAGKLRQLFLRGQD